MPTLQTGVIETKIVASVDKKSFGDGINFARDTGVKIDQALKSELTLDTIKFNDKIKNIRSQLKQDIPEKRRVELEIELGDTKSELTEARRRLNNLKNTGDASLSRLQAKFNETNKAIAESNTFVGRLKTGFKNLVAGAAGFFAVSKFKDLGSSIFNLTSQLQSANAAFTSLLDSEERAADLLKEIDVFASRTPFNKLKIIDTTKQLLGFGFAAEDAISTLESVGNAVSAVGGTDETLSGVVAALGQIQAKGKLSTEEVLQIAERGLPIFEILRDDLKLTEEQLGNIGNAGITAAEALPVILQGFQDRFAGSLEAQAQTLQGRLSNLVDSTQLLLSKIGTALIPVFNAILAAGAGLIGFIDRFGTSLLSAVAVVGTASLGFGVYTGAVSLAASATTALGAALTFITGPVGIAVLAIGALTAAFSLFSGSADINIAAMGRASERAGVLAGNINNLKTSVDDLNKAYKEGNINAVEYAKAKKELESQIILTTKALEAEVELNKLLNKEYIEATEALVPLNTELGFLNKRYLAAEESVSILTKRYGENSKITQDAIAKQKSIGDEINRVTGEIDELIAVERIQITTQEEVNNTLNQLSGANTIAAFNNIKKAQVAKIQGDIQVIQSELLVQKALGGASPLGPNPQLLAQQQQGLLAVLQLQRNIADIESIGFSGVGGGGSTSTGGGGGKSQATIAKEKEIKEIERLEEQAIKDAEKRAKEEADITEEVFKDAFDAIGDTIKDKEKNVTDFTKEIEKSIDKIADIDAKIGDLGASAAQDLASRFVEVQSELADPDTDPTNLAALQEELALITANTTEAERQEAIRKEGLSDAEKILEKRDAEITALEAQKIAEQEALDLATAGRDAALTQIGNLRAEEQRLSEEAIKQTGIEFDAKAKKAQEYSDLLDSLFGDTVTGGTTTAGGIPPAAGSVGGTGETVVNEGDVVLNQTIEGVIDQRFVNFILEEAARRIKDTRKTQGSS